MAGDSRTRRSLQPARAAWLPWAFTAAAILAQIAWPLTSGDLRTTTTEVVVVMFTAASISHAAVHRGARWTLAFTGISLAFGFLVELIGTSTGAPFSSYAYTGELAPQVLGVPVIIPLAWTMMSYPALLVGRRLVTGRGGRILLGAVALATWDLFLDPQMVGEGYWRWDHPDPTLPGVPGIPIVNFAGWLLAAAILMAALSWLPDVAAPEGVPATLYLWTWLGGIIANAVFLDRPWVALWGGLGMGLVALPYAVTLYRDTVDGAARGRVGTTGISVSES